MLNGINCFIKMAKLRNKTRWRVVMLYLESHSFMQIQWRLNIENIANTVSSKMMIGKDNRRRLGCMNLLHWGLCLCTQYRRWHKLIMSVYHKLLLTFKARLECALCLHYSCNVSVQKYIRIAHKFFSVIRRWHVLDCKLYCELYRSRYIKQQWMTLKQI